MMTVTATLQPTTSIKEALEVQEFISSSEAAKRLRVTTRSITRWIEEGEFPGAFKANPEVKNSPYLIPIREFEKFAENRKASQQND